MRNLEIIGRLEIATTQTNSTYVDFAAQAAVAREAGTKMAIAYVNRATRLLGDGIK